MAVTKSKKSVTFQTVSLQSSAGTGVCYYTRRPTKGEKVSIQLKKRKYDKVTRCHQLFTQHKIARGQKK